MMRLVSNVFVRCRGPLLQVRLRLMCQRCMRQSCAMCPASRMTDRRCIQPCHGHACRQPCFQSCWPARPECVHVLSNYLCMGRVGEPPASIAVLRQGYQWGATAKADLSQPVPVPPKCMSLGYITQDISGVHRITVSPDSKHASEAQLACTVGHLPMQKREKTSSNTCSLASSPVTCAVRITAWLTARSC